MNESGWIRAIGDLCARIAFALFVGFCLAAAPPIPARAGTPVTLFESLAGDLDFIGTEGTFRANTNPTSCTRNATASNSLAGIPAGATIQRAYLYWAGSGSTVDSSVSFSTPAGTQTVNASRTFTETFVFGGTNYDFFSGFADVTTLVAAGGNGTYSMSGLTFNTGAPHCGVSAVVGGWSLVVVFEDAAEPLRVINIFDGFQFFRGSQITLTPSNFIVPVSPINGKLAHITWEGDSGNSSALGGFTENIRFEGVPLTDALNPLNNQFNSSSNAVPDANSHGVDFDVYDISAQLSAGMTSGSSVYSSGGDLVLLSSEIFSVTNTPVTDLAITKSHTGDFIVGTNNSYTITVNNNGPNAESGTIIVSDTLPTGLGFVSATGTGWACGAAGQVVTCTNTAGLASGAALPPITLTVSVAGAAAPSVTNTATVSGPTFDNVSGNDSSSDLTTVRAPADILVVKSVTTTSDPVNGGANPKAIPGATMTYSVLVTNQGAGTVDADTLWVTDTLPALIDMLVGDGSVSPVVFIDGATSSGLTLVWGGFADLTDDVDFDDGSATWIYQPTPGTTDPNVRAIRIRPSGSMAGAGGGNPSFELRFQGLIH